MMAAVRTTEIVSAAPAAADTAAAAAASAAAAAAAARRHRVHPHRRVHPRQLRYLADLDRSSNVNTADETARRSSDYGATSITNAVRANVVKL